MLKRCYYITDTNGCIIVRISRWDESRIDRALSFVSGSPLWAILSGHPAYDGKDSAQLQGNGIAVCFDQDKISIGSTSYTVPGSFMVNREEEYAEKFGSACKDAVSAAVRRSFVTQVCAAYYLEGNSYKMKFYPCNEDCPVGPSFGAQ